MNCYTVLTCINCVEVLGKQEMGKANLKEVAPTRMQVVPPHLPSNKHKLYNE